MVYGYNYNHIIGYNYYYNQLNGYNYDLFYIIILNYCSSSPTIIVCQNLMSPYKHTHAAQSFFANGLTVTLIMNRFILCSRLPDRICF